jgi:hypothetical protein
MIFRAAAVTLMTGLVCATSPADAASRKTPKKAVPVAVVVVASPEWQTWRALYCEDWGPNGFGMMAGALPHYALNAFPHWHGECRIWSPHYSASGTARW